jgi:hypothetical protein
MPIQETLDKYLKREKPELKIKYERKGDPGAWIAEFYVLGGDPMMDMIG